MSSSLPPRNHATFTLYEIARATKGTLHNVPDSAASTCSVVTDTRLLENAPASTCGPLFVALRGENFDGHRFLDSAFEQGASAALVETAPENRHACISVEDTQIALGELAKFHRARFAGPIIGVTGSYGKTTTRAFIATALAAKYGNRVLATEGNFNNEIGVPLTVLALDKTQHEIAVLELAMRGSGQIDYLANIAQPTLGVITNIGPQHIELLGSLENVARAKAEILAHLPNNGTAILPRDDQFFEQLKSAAPCAILSFGTHEGADFRITDFQETESGGRCVLSHDGAKYQLSLPLPGLHNAINAACAIAAASTCGIEIGAAIDALASVEVPGARMRLVRNEAREWTIIDDCYNAGPDSMRAALQVLAALPGEHRRVAILGAMKELGAWSESEHRKLGVLALESGVDVLAGVGEEAHTMTESAVDWMKKNGAQRIIAWCPDAAAASEMARQLARAGDVILVKGSRSVGLELVVSALEYRE